MDIAMIQSAATGATMQDSPHCQMLQVLCALLLVSCGFQCLDFQKALCIQFHPLIVPLMISHLWYLQNKTRIDSSPCHAESQTLEYVLYLLV